MSRMKIGLVYPQTELGGDPDAVRRIGLAAAELGYDHLLAYDHVVGAVHDDRLPKLWGPYTDQHPFHDPFVMFAHLAAITESLEFASGVLILPQRQTVLVAKQAADVDLLSGERLRLGVGVGWNYVEYEALGQDFSTRGRRADEQIEYLRRLWSSDLVDWEGEFDRIDRGNIVPRPNRSIPIWVGGFSDAAFRRGVSLGDGFMYAGDEGRVIEARRRLHELAAEHGRDLDDFGEDFVATRPGSAADVRGLAERWQALGGSHLSIASMGLGLDSVEAHLDFFAEVASAVIDR